MVRLNDLVTRHDKSCKSSLASDSHMSQDDLMERFQSLEKRTLAKIVASRK